MISVPLPRPRDHLSSLASQRLDPLGEEELGPEEPRLLDRPVGQLTAAHPAREAEVVADAGARARLSAGHARVDDHGGQAFGGAVDGRRQTRRSRADDGDVARHSGSGCAEAEHLDQLGVARVGGHPSGVEPDGRQHGPVEVHLGEGRDALVRVRLEKGERDVGAGQHVTQFVRAVLPALTDDRDRVQLGHLGPAPVGEVLRHRQVEPRFPGQPRHEEIAVGPAQHHGPSYGMRGPLATAHQQYSAGVRMGPSYLREELDSGGLPVELDAREDGREDGDVGQNGTDRCRLQLDDPVVRRIALCKVSGQGCPGALVVGDHGDRRIGNQDPSSPAWSALPSRGNVARARCARPASTGSAASPRCPARPVCDGGGDAPHGRVCAQRVAAGDRGFDQSGAYAVHLDLGGCAFGDQLAGARIVALTPRTPPYVGPGPRPPRASNRSPRTSSAGGSLRSPATSAARTGPRRDRRRRPPPAPGGPSRRWT